MSTPILDHLWIIPLLPLLGSAANGLLGWKWPNKVVHAVALSSTGLSFACALEAVREFLGYYEANHHAYVKAFFDWIVAGSFRAGFDLAFDQLTVVMVLVVTGVGFLIHIYSTGYMAHEGGYFRFFSYLNLFMFFMLLLVLAANYSLMFVGWEGVGLCSYLLIGFWYLKKTATDAGNKAFIVNRIGDFGFMLGMFLLFRTFHTLDFAAVFQQAGALPSEAMGQFGTLTIACILLFVGATGKSAQLPLYVWLPDAMEGPTPVSALIHAATMVTAGVYIVARSHILFMHSETAMLIVAIVGCATAFFAATIGLVQSDIKKVLAYSTVSQLGYMFLGCGVGAFTAGIFHLMTHAFFKALLFLAAGSVIHAMGGEQDMWKMGGLGSQIKITFWTMLCATLAIAGFFPFAAFFSKDAILAATFNSESGGKALYTIGLLAAVLTSFYMFRLIWLTFAGQKRYDEHHVHVHESPLNMTVPLMILAFLSLTGGWFALPAMFGGKDYFSDFMTPVLATEEHANVAGAHNLELILSGVAMVAATLGLLVAWRMYRKDVKQGPSKGLHEVLYQKYYVDELYHAVVVGPLVWLSRNVLWKVVDVGVIDGSVNGIAKGTSAVGDTVRQTQSGNTRSYAVWVLVGALVVFTIIFWPLVHPLLFGGVR
ncbi:MAG TPA: NADH-quinone oxidoreductase subunit L [Candidatus Eremiobacteraceae bacterium]|nr:NADH-quinone oxidoreductase subunit L [Candidatus Eremiobacteraceae bacterium]